MAGSHRSPVLKDQWRGSGDPGDQRGRDRHRPRGSHRDRGRDRFRDRDRRRWPKEGRPDHSSRSPPPRSFPGPDNEPQQRDFPTNHASTRGSPGPSHLEIRSSQKPNRNHSLEPIDRRGPESVMRPGDRDQRREYSPSAPPSKRKRTRSPSPGGFHNRPPTHPRGAPPRQGPDFDRSLPNSKRRGRLPGRGRPSRRPSPRRGRDRRKHEGPPRDSSQRRHSRSPGWEDRHHTNQDWRLHSPRPDDELDRNSYHRSPSRHSAGTQDSRPSARSRRGSKHDVTMYPPLSPPRQNADPAADTNRVSADSTGFGARISQRRRPSRSPDNSYHGSTRSNSPYSASRVGGSGQHPRHLGQHGSRQGNPSGNDSPSHHSRPHSSHATSSHIYRDGQPKYRETHQDRRPSVSGPSGPHSHGRSRFNSPQRDALDSRSRAAPPSPPQQGPPAENPPPPPPPTEPRSHREAYQNFSNHQPTSRDSRAGDEGWKHDSGTGTAPTAQTDTRPPDTSSTPNKGGKISFAFKAKTGPPSAPKPVPDLAQRMLAREPPPRAAEPPRNRMSNGPPPRFKPEPRFDRRDRDRDRQRDRDRNRGRNDRRDYREPRDFREPRDPRDNRRDDRRGDQRHDKRRNDRGNYRAQDFRPERRHERSPEPVKRPKVMLRPKPRPTISEEFAKSDSVYFRKPGNESVIGAGTYGKVFKAIHVYTQRKVALKKIRMEGEKDGFPVTAVREIKLLQHLRNHNVVSLLEVMVERNECFMVFEYLSHDLTGLINHPTFTLTAAHKKDLAKQMFEGLHYLHHRGVLHRDIKAANILISNQGRLKYADFGLARFFSKSRQLDYTNRVITIWYRPPELLLGETRYGPAVDVWSAACVYVEMFTKKAVFPGEGGEISQLDKLYNMLGTPTRAEWPDITEMPWFQLMRPTERKKRIFEDVYRDTLSPAALDMISQVFRYDPAKRPTAEEVLAHPYFHSEEPSPQQPIELEKIQGDWHEFESKALRKERDREARRAEYQKDKEKRKPVPVGQDEREPKRIKQDTSEGLTSSVPPAEQR